MHISDALDIATGMMRQDQWADALKILNDGYNSMPNNPWMPFLVGTCHRKLGHTALAHTLFLHAMELKYAENGEKFLEAMLGMSDILREQGKYKLEKDLLTQCKKMAPDDPRVEHNLAGYYINAGQPNVAERYARQSMAKYGRHPDSLTQLGIALLAQEKFADGWDAWDECALLGGASRKVRNFWALGQTPWWDGNPGKSVVVYGEQGHGDEIMFASCMNEAIKVCNQVYIDTSKPDMAALYQRSFPEAVVLCTPDSQVHEWHTERKIDAALPFGSLPSLYRRKSEDFPEHDGFLKASNANKRDMRKRLDALGSRPKIGIAWKGGVPHTQGVLRTIPLTLFAPILKLPAEFVSVQYTVDADLDAAYQQDATGVPLHHWNSVVKDFDMLTALIDELDLLITVPQTALHQRGGLGKECWILVPSQPSWPFGQTRDNCIWYPKQTRLFRQRDGEGWELTIMRVAAELAKWLGVPDIELSKPIAPVIETIDFRPKIYAGQRAV